MRIIFVVAIAILSGAALSQSDVSMADRCMYNQVTLMSDSGQKLAFSLTKTELTVHTRTTYHTVTESVEQKPTEHVTVVQTKKGLVSEDEVAKHGGWTAVCKYAANKCHDKRGQKGCRTWKKACKAHGQGFKWTVKPHVVVTQVPSKFKTGGFVITNGKPIIGGKKPIKPIIGGKKPIKPTKGGKKPTKPTKAGKLPCIAFAKRQTKKVCLRRNKKNRCIKHRLYFKINKCLAWKTIMKKKWTPAQSIFKPDVYYSIIRSRRANLSRL